jgi:hypothetical protein
MVVVASATGTDKTAKAIARAKDLTRTVFTGISMWLLIFPVDDGTGFYGRGLRAPQGAEGLAVRIGGGIGPVVGETIDLVHVLAPESGKVFEGDR